MASNVFNFGEFIRKLESAGLIDALIPFLLIFIIIFAILEKIKLLGEDKKRMNVILALVFSLIVVIPHLTGNLPAGYDPVLIINAALPSVSLLIVAILALMVLIGIFAQDRLLWGVAAPGWIAFLSIVSILVIFGSAAGWWASGFLDWLEDVFGSDALAVVIMILVFGIIIAYVTGGEKDREKIGAWNRLGFNVKDLFGKK